MIGMRNTAVFPCPVSDIARQSCKNVLRAKMKSVYRNRGELYCKSIFELALACPYSNFYGQNLMKNESFKKFSYLKFVLSVSGKSKSSQLFNKGGIFSFSAPSPGVIDISIFI